MPQDPIDQHCDCPKFTVVRAGRERLVNHTYACLVARRNNRSLTEYYGPPASRIATPARSPL